MKRHVSNIPSKLHLADRTQAAIYGLQRGLIPLNNALEPPYAKAGTGAFKSQKPWSRSLA